MLRTLPARSCGTAAGANSASRSKPGRTWCAGSKTLRSCWSKLPRSSTPTSCAAATLWALPRPEAACSWSPASPWRAAGMRLATRPAAELWGSPASAVSPRRLSPAGPVAAPGGRHMPINGPSLLADASPELVVDSCKKPRRQEGACQQSVDRKLTRLRRRPAPKASSWSQKGADQVRPHAAGFGRLAQATMAASREPMVWANSTQPEQLSACAELRRRLEFGCLRTTLPGHCCACTAAAATLASAQSGSVAPKAGMHCRTRPLPRPACRPGSRPPCG